MSRAASIFDPTIIRAAATDSLRKLNPRATLRNPVMAIVFVGAVLVTVVFFRDLASSSAAQNVFTGLVGAWLWFTVLFANFAEAMAEGRGKAQAASLRRTRSETVAHRRRTDGGFEIRNRLATVRLARIAWTRIDPAAAGLSHSEITLAAERAAKDAILAGRDQITTADLLDALHERRATAPGR